MSENAMSILFLVFIIVVMYLTLIRPQKKKEKETNAMRSSLMVGDEIVTIGGFLGKIVKTKEESVIIQCGADKTKLEIMRWGISKVVEEGGGNRAQVDAIMDEDDEVKKPSRPKRMKKAVEEAPAEEAPAQEAPATEE